MDENVVIKWLLGFITTLFLVIGYFFKDKLDGMSQRLLRAESDNRRLEGVIQEIQLDNLKKWDEIKTMFHNGITGMSQQLAAGAVVFEGIRKDIEYMRGNNHDAKD